MAIRPKRKKPAKRTAKTRTKIRKSGKATSAKPKKRVRLGTGAARAAIEPAKRGAKRRVTPGNKPKPAKPDPKFAKAGHIGAIPDPVETWLEGLGASVPENKPFIINSDGGEVKIDAVGKYCGNTFYVAYNYKEATPKDCAGLNLQGFVARGEAKAQKTADDLIEKCEGDGCVGDGQVDYVAWNCYAAAKAGSTVAVEIVLRVECVEI
jgi:hypothetical protein